MSEKLRTFEERTDNIRKNTHIEDRTRKRPVPVIDYFTTKTTNQQRTQVIEKVARKRKS